MDRKAWMTQRSQDPFHPYKWVARYSDGTTFSQFEMDQSRTSKDIDLNRVTELLVLNHPVSPLVVFAQLGRPDEVITETKVDMTPVVGSDEWNYFIVAHLFGFRYGTEKHVIRIDKDGVVKEEFHSEPPL